MSQRSDVECTGCGALIGVEHSYNCGYYGQDPPETIFEDEDSVVFDEENNPFCTQECMDGYYGLREESREDEDDAQGNLFEEIEERIEHDNEEKLKSYKQSYRKRN